MTYKTTLISCENDGSIFPKLFELRLHISSFPDKIIIVFAVVKTFYPLSKKLERRNFLTMDTADWGLEEVLNPVRKALRHLEMFPCKYQNT
jgi:hypothetical protein